MRNLGYYFRNRSPSDFIHNRLVQWRDPELKIFFIGFNKSATSAIFHFLARQGVKSAHWRAGTENLALEIEKRIGNPPALKRYLMPWTAFSDLTLSSEQLMLDGNRHFRLFHDLFPKSYFVLNDRDPESWVASRMRHRRGQFAERSARFRGCAVEDLPAAWRREREEHNQAVPRLTSRTMTFLHFRVDEDGVRNSSIFCLRHSG